jgi:hypothetical protein
VSAPYSAFFSCELGLICPVISCSWADIFCVPMMQCLRSDREIRAWGRRQAFAKHKGSRICFSATSELCCWRCQHKNHQATKWSRIFSSYLPFLFSHVSSASKTSILHGLILVCFTTLKSWVAAFRTLLNPEGSRPVAGLSTMISLLAKNGKESSGVDAKSTRPLCSFRRTSVSLFAVPFGVFAIASF